MDDNTPQATTPPSKTRRKATMHALQTLGERLAELPLERLRKIDMPEALLDAIRQAQGMNHDEARRRQMQYVGKLMRSVDPAPIEAALAAFDGVSATEIARHHRLERLRTRLLDDESTLTEIIASHPGADAQHLRQLRRNAIKEREQNRPPRSFRALFQELKALEGPEAPAEPENDE